VKTSSLKRNRLKCLPIKTTHQKA